LKKLLTLTVTASLVLAFAFSAFAQTKTTITGQLRSRNEMSRKSFDAADEHYTVIGHLRTRINFKAEVDDNASAFVQLQDTRMYGGSGQSATLNSDSNVGVHQAYLKYNLFTKDKWSLGAMAGRFEFNWGNQRLLGAVGWHNVGRSWEGGLLWYDAEKFSVTFGGLKVAETENADDGYNGDTDAYAFAVKIKEVNLDLLFLMEDNKDTSGLATVQAAKRTTMAAYYKRKMEQIDMEFNFALQGGTVALTPTTEADFGGMMFTGQIGYSLEGERNPWVAVGIDYTSGDDDFTDTDIKTFNNLYWTGHKFNGYMDYFLSGGPNGLMDMMFRGKVDITNGWTLAADLHIFSAAEEYMGATEMTKDVGSEIDITIKTSRVKGVALQWGYSMFSAKDEFADETDKQSGTWAYCQAAMNF